MTTSRFLSLFVAACLASACGDGVSEGRSSAAPADDCGVTRRGNGQQDQSGLVDGRQYRGLALEEAKRQAQEKSHVLSIAGTDGACSDLPSDLRGDRVIVYVQEGRVASAVGG